MIKLGINNINEPENKVLPGVFFDINENNYHRVLLNDEALEALNFNKAVDTLTFADCDNELALIKVTGYPLEDVEGAKMPTIVKESRRKLTKGSSSFHNKVDFFDAVEVLGIKEFWNDNKSLNLRAYPLDYKVGGMVDTTILVLRVETPTNINDESLPNDLFGNIEDISKPAETVDEALESMEFVHREVAELVEVMDAKVIEEVEIKEFQMGDTEVKVEADPIYDAPQAVDMGDSRDVEFEEVAEPYQTTAVSEGEDAF